MGGLSLELDRFQHQIDQYQQPAAWANRIFAAVAKWQRESVRQEEEEKKKNSDRGSECGTINSSEIDKYYMKTIWAAAHGGVSLQMTRAGERRTPPRSACVLPTTFFHENLFLICPISSFKEALCEFNLLQ